jgi:phage terminase large subunit GpA-like protein
MDIAVLSEYYTDPVHEAALRAQVREIIAQSFSPPPDLTVSEWADAYRILSAEASSEPGKWSTARVEPSRGIMDAFADPDIEIITAMVAAQTVKTEVINNVTGYHVHLDPCPMLILQPTLQMAEAYSKDRLAPMIRDTPQLSAKIGINARDSEDTILHKKYPGGHITMAGANSPASLASRPIRILLCDEVDRYEASAGKEGDPVSLAIERTTTFWNRKIALVSTPTIKGASRIESSYEESDQRRFFVNCPKCGHLQHLRWKQVRWPEGSPLDAKYHCEYQDGDTGEVCDYGWSEAERLQAIQGGIWIATKPEVKGHAGFHLNRIASPWRALGEMARDFELVRKHPERLKTWVNTRLAETWEERGERANPDTIYGRREDYDASDGERMTSHGRSTIASTMAIRPPPAFGRSWMTRYCGRSSTRPASLCASKRRASTPVVITRSKSMTSSVRVRAARSTRSRAWLAPAVRCGRSRACTTSALA